MTKLTDLLGIELRMEKNIAQQIDGERQILVENFGVVTGLLFRGKSVEDAAHGVLTQAWSPIGGITFYRDGNHSSTLDDPVIGAIAEIHSKSPAQVMLRWGLQHGRSVIPKSTKPSRIAENIDVFDFELSSEEMISIDGLDTGRRGGPEPEAVTIEAFGREIPES
jgi:predicted oxidoreductase